MPYHSHARALWEDRIGRIYLRFWINWAMQKLGVPLKEYVHYTFSFFGGSNLKHATLTLAPIPELINLLSIHQNSYVILDSDRTRTDDAPQKTYTRDFIKNKCDYKDRIWLTNGREIENYLRDEVLIWAAGGTEGSASAAMVMNRDFGVFHEQVLRVRDALGRARAAHDASDENKTSFAREAVQYMMSKDNVNWLDRLNLHQEISEIVKFIHRANNL